MFNLLWMSPFNSGTLSGNILGINLPVVDCWQNSVFTLQIIEGFTLSPLTKTPWVLIFTSLSSIFNACKLLQQVLLKEKLCLHLLTINNYRTLVYKGYATKHPVKNQFTPVHLWESFGLTQVYIFCDGTLQVFILSVNLPNGSASKNTDRILWKLMWHSQNPLMKTLWVLILPSFKSIFLFAIKWLLWRNTMLWLL